MENRRGGVSRSAVGTTSDDVDVVKALIDSNKQMANEMEYLRNRLNALEMQQQQQQQASGGAALINGNVGGVGHATATMAPATGGDSASDAAVAASTAVQTTNNATTVKRGIKWRDSLDGLDISDHHQAPASNADANNGPPMRKIKFMGSSNTANQGLVASTKQGEGGDVNQITNSNIEGIVEDGDDSSSTTSSSSSEDEDAIAFSGWARCFFQARHHRSATQITSGATSTTSQDTYLHLTIPSTANELRISSIDPTSINDKDGHKINYSPPPPPLLIDPPIPLKHFYAVKVPGSHSGAALFLKNDSRRLRKYIFRFEFINRAVHQPPNKYLQFVRSGKAAKNSMKGINKLMSDYAFNKMGEERRETMKENKKRARDAFAAHLGTLDDLLRECNDCAERFVDCVNTRNEEEEELELLQQQRELLGSGVANGSGLGGGSRLRNRRSKPPPPYWGSGFNRPSHNASSDIDDDDEDAAAGGDSESDFSEEDDELYYDDDNDDETFFDKVQVSTEQTLETLFNHIVK